MATVDGHSTKFRAIVIGVVVVIFAAILPVAVASPTAAVGEVLAITVNRSAPFGVSHMATGATHTQKSLLPGGDAAAIASARALLTSAVAYQNQHLYGWGTSNPNPSPGVYSFASLDRRVQLMRSMGAVPVITLCCAPDWMTPLGTTTTTYSNRPPTATHYADFAELARRVALRYPDVTHYVVWNEMKGFWDGDAGQWDEVSYTAMYNDVYDALKSVNPAIQVGGPYLVIESTGSLHGGSVTEMPVTRRNEVFLRYWRTHAHGADFVAIDRKVHDYNDTFAYTHAQLLALTANYETVVRQVQSITGLPVWFIEQHFVGKAGGPVDFQAAGIAANLVHMLLGGAHVAMGWEPEQDTPGGPVQENLYTSTAAAGGGQPLPILEAYRDIHEGFPPGTTLYTTTASAPEVLVLASATRVMIVNLAPIARAATLDGRPITLAPYEVSLRDTVGNIVHITPKPASAAAASQERSTATSVSVASPVDAMSIDENGAEVGDSAPSGMVTAKVAAAAVADTAALPLDWLGLVATDQQDRVKALVADEAGVIVGGMTSGAVGPTGRRGGADGFVRRYRPDGTIVWTAQFGNRWDQSVAGIAEDSSGATYAVGSTDSALPGLVSLGRFDAFIRKYDQKGAVQWTREFGSDGDDAARAVAVRDDIVYVAGQVDSAMSGQPAIGFEDVFVTAFDLSGTRLWTTVVGTTEPDRVTGLVATPDGIALSGFTGGNVPGGTNAGNWDAMVASLTPTGTLRWFRQFGTAGDDRAFGLAADNAGVYVVGRSEGGLDGHAFGGQYDGFIRAFGRNGSFRWSTPMATGDVDALSDIAVDRGQLTAVGTTMGTIDGQQRVGSRDLVMSQVATTGGALVSTQFGTPSSDVAHAVAMVPGHLYVAGETNGAFAGMVAGGGVDGFVGGRADATVVATDSFSRVVAAGWGALGMGGTYGVSPKTAFTVQNGTGLIALVPGAAEVTATPTAVAALDVDLQASLAFELSVGDSASVALAVRRAGAEGEYRARLLVQANGTVLLRLLLRTRTGTVPLTGEFTVPGGPLAPGAVIHLEVAATGVAPTVLTARAWTGDTPPATWALTAVNAEPMLQVSGGVGVRAKLAGAATTPVGVRVDDLLAVLTTV